MPNIAPTKDQLLMAEFMAEQELLSVVREAIDRSDLDRTEIARRLGIHRSNISKVLNTPRNLTVRMAARLLRAAGARMHVTALPVPEGGVTQEECFQRMGENVATLRVKHRETSSSGTLITVQKVAV